MNFAINYSSQAAGLLSEGSIELDYFKTPDWPWMVLEASRLRPVAVHFTLKAGDGKLKSTNWEKVARLLEQTGTPFVNLHFEPSVAEFSGVSADTDHPLHRQQVIDRMLSDLSAVGAVFGPEHVILENVPYRGPTDKVLRLAVDPEVISQLVKASGCGLLLDISHARIAAHSLKMDARAYMSQLPVDCLRELHFTGLHTLNGGLQDHLEALETDWPYLEWVLERIRLKEWAKPWLLAFEYGGIGEKFAWRTDAQVIQDQVPRLYAMSKLV
jgi:uncharacterized protein (UPF0276 family)